MSQNNTEMTSKFIVQRKVQFVLTTNESRRVYRDTTTEQFLAAVSHSMGAHTEALSTADSSSSNEDETYEASPATTSESSQTLATVQRCLCCIKRKIQKNSDQQSQIVARSSLRWTVASLRSVNQWSISVQSSSV